MDCFNKSKCDWCKKRKMNSELWTIDIWCKWYGFKICERCYDDKINSRKV